ncbi:lytic transglycosylase domain-containing protein [Microbacterium limosum]|uniref:Lytic transglycosylase domain-containing protein n=1 Tax=Microbacterium limosum TaxID=3079935 RepID=A0AAU0MIW7_9MICO|nr:lytic transglycosylase domain-containing protein [Microbacterium sp. Y20]WOQ70564.1 lytic transglycosylase domain-containing protein [Microbacterium sp. Y20]
MSLGNEITPAPTRGVSRAHASGPALRPAAVRWSRRRSVTGVFAAVAASAFLAAYVLAPTGTAIAEQNGDAPVSALTSFAAAQEDAQSLVVEAASDAATDGFGRSGYEVYVTPKPTPTPEPVAPRSSGGGSASGWAPPAVSPDPGSAKAIAYDMVMARGWSSADYDCLVALWQKESGWRVNAHNRSSGAYGIPQSLPGSKMASAGADWETSAATQITWGLGYIGGRYGTPCGAWGHSQARGWY